TLVSFTDNDTDNIVNNSTNVTLTATFSESMIASPAISISGLVTSTSMTVSSSTNSTTWTYLWDVPAGSDGVYFATVSATDLVGNLYSGTESITFTVDNTDPILQSASVTDTNSKLIVTYNEPVKLYDPSYSTSNFTVDKSGGTANISYTGYSFSSTDSNTIILNITVTGEPTGDELLEVGPTGASTLIDGAGNYALDYADSSQTSNTVYLTNTPPKFTSTTVNSNNASITIVFSEGVTAVSGSGNLSTSDFTLAVTGGTAVLGSATPLSLSKTDSTTYVLGTSYTTQPNGTEILSVTPISSAVFDSKGTKIDLTQTQSNTVQLNDTQGPSITGTTIEAQNKYVDFTFSEGVYSTTLTTAVTSSSISISQTSGPVTSSSFSISQTSGPTFSAAVTSVTTTAGGSLNGGETTVRFNLDLAGIKPTGQEVYAITAVSSSSVVDSSGNSMLVTQTNNTFQLKPPTSGGVSTAQSTIAVAPTELIGNAVNAAVITVQSKDSLGQNFFEGGYQVTLFSPQGDLPTTDNQNGIYTATYIPVVPSSDSVDISFGFRVIDVNGASTALLAVHRDDDGDGVFNSLDQCPNTEAGLVVDATGCALNQLDDDNDGVTDDID
ncbi:MAG: invasin domain 3-containing protein, partial [Methylophagaceae bacterium]